MATTKASFHWDDPLLLNNQLTDDERAVRDAAAAYCQERLAPRVTMAFRDGTTDPAIFREMGELGLLGATIPEAYGGAALNYVCYGLVAREVERVDSGYRSMMSVQSSLVMVPINEFGSEAQKQKYLPKLARGEWIGCFGLTEPDFGSPTPAACVTRAKKATATAGCSTARRCGSPTAPDRRPRSWCGPRTDDGDQSSLKGFIVEKGMPRACRGPRDPQDKIEPARVRITAELSFHGQRARAPTRTCLPERAPE